jgi:hypothetical protein
MNGAELITAERQRQIDVEQWTPDHDDKHSGGELAQAAEHYIDSAEAQRAGLVDWDWGRCPFGWPWDKKWWKPSPDPIRNLVKAGALLCAEIDRLQRKAEKATK